MKRLHRLFQTKKRGLLSLYFTAGFPKKNDTLAVLENLESTGEVDMVEIGIPFSDPIADGEIIQKSNNQAIKNGMTLSLLLQELKKAREITQIPILLMGYFNPIMQFGVEAFCRAARTVDIDGLIIPDLPLEIYRNNYKSIFRDHHLENIQLVTPQTSYDRAKLLCRETGGFLYVVSSSSITGKKHSFDHPESSEYFQRINKICDSTPKLIGFGVSDNTSFQKALGYADGAIIGSAFIKALSQEPNLKKGIKAFVKKIRG